ncbi:hypothetical protein TNCV_1870531 [Trichonephila clavipes]|nr:hypothetical protein TNCV_1870531 [Trichonephila clavipes]
MDQMGSDPESRPRGASSRSGFDRIEVMILINLTAKYYSWISFLRSTTPQSGPWSSEEAFSRPAFLLLVFSNF